MNLQRSAYATAPTLYSLLTHLSVTLSLHFPINTLSCDAACHHSFLATVIRPTVIISSSRGPSAHDNSFAVSVRATGNNKKVMFHFLAALYNRMPLYFCCVVSFFYLSFFFPRLISAATDWMSTILPHNGVALVRV